MASRLVDDLRDALAPDRVHDEALDRSIYGRDASLIRGEAGVVCFPDSTEEVRACVRIARAHGRPFVPRGSGTGLAGGAVPVGDPVVIVTTRMTRVLAVDPDERVAWVEPGVLNLDLSRHVAGHGLHFAPDPSSQQSCSVGGNVANNSGGPHCLRYGVTSAHVLAIEVVLPDGEVTVLGGPEPEPPGYDLRGAFVGSEGCFGIATRIAVRLTPTPPAVRTLLLAFAEPHAAAATVSGIIAAGLVPAAMEMMDADITRAVEDFVHAGYPRDAGAVLLVELDGLPGGVEAGVEVVRRVALDQGARSVRVAADDAERALLWKGRKNAFGAIARLTPDYYLHDTVVPRTRLVEVLQQVYDIGARHGLLVANVFHAGDGNLHPLIGFDARQPGALERVHAAGAEIVEASLAAGGVLSGEHGIGLEKREFMDRLFSADDLDAQARLRAAFDPDGAANPEKVLPAGARCTDLQRIPEGAWIWPAAGLRSFAEEVGADDPVSCVGGRTQWDVGGAADPAAREVRAPAGVREHVPAEMTVRCGAGTVVADLAAALAEHGQMVPLDPPRPEAATVGGVLAVGRSGLRRLGYGPVRDVLLEARYVSAEGRLVKAGGPTVKNVSGFDLCRLLVGSLGTLGLLGEVVLRVRPVPPAARWLAGTADPFPLRRRLLGASSILWDGATTWVLLEGHPADVAAEAASLDGFAEVDGPPPLPAGGRRSLAPSALRTLSGTFVAEVGVGVVHVPERVAPVAPADPVLHRRVKALFDPGGRLNPGRSLVPA